MNASVAGDANGPAIPCWNVLRDRYADDASDCSDVEPTGVQLGHCAGESDGDLSDTDEQDVLEAAVWAEVYEGMLNARNAVRLSLSVVWCHCPCKALWRLLAFINFLINYGITNKPSVQSVPLTIPLS